MNAWEFVAIREIIDNVLGKDDEKITEIMNQIELYLICNDEKYKNFKDEFADIVLKKLIKNKKMK